MANCSICNNVLRKGRNIFQEYIGDPPILLRDLIMEPIYLDLKVIGKEVCRSCCGKLLKYYEAAIVLQQIKQDILQLFGSRAINIKDEQFDEEKVEMFDKWFEEVQTEQLVDEEVIITKNFDYNSDENSLERCVKAELTSDEALKKSDDEVFDRSFNSKCKVKNVKHKKKRRKHSDEKTVITCSECNKVFVDRREYDIHYKKEHFKGYVCEQCGKKFQSQTGFETHCATHNPVKRFVCSECGASYHYKYYLKRHMASHTDERPYQCDICTKSFVHQTRLRRHQQIHDKSNRRIECEVCGFKFRTTYHLRRHSLTHTGAKPFSCPVCGKCFAVIYNMKIHLREHEHPGSTRQRRYRCRKCPATFTNEKNYEDHCKRNVCEATTKEINQQDVTI